MTAIRVNYLHEVDERQPTFLAIGSFDGVHKGHQLLLQTMVAAAREADARTAVLTFFPHPQRVLSGLKGRYYLSTIDERVEALAAQGIDLVIARPFDDEVRRTRAATFMARLQERLDMRQLWGGDFALGYKREGTVPVLRQLGQEMGYTVQLVDGMVEWDGAVVSSSRTRQALAEGNVEEVAGCLGRPYVMCGVIIEGKKLGRTINFPTANLAEWDEQLMPANGVYGAMAQLGERRFMAAVNVGTRPTVNGKAIRVEAHLLDFDENIYGETLRLEFMTRIRAEKKFNGLDELKAQIQADVAEIRHQLSN